MAQLAALLPVLEGRLREFGAPIAEAFRPGAAPGRVREALAAAGLDAHEDLVVWWGWHDGAEAIPPGSITTAETSLVSPWFMPTLDEAIYLRRQRHALYQDGDEGEAARLAALFPRSWLPVLTTELGSDLCADTAAAGPAPLNTISKEVEVSLDHFSSLSEFVELVLLAFEQGLVKRHPLEPRFLGFVWEDLPGDMRRLATWP